MSDPFVPPSVTGPPASAQPRNLAYRPLVLGAAGLALIVAVVVGVLLTRGGQASLTGRSGAAATAGASPSTASAVPTASPSAAPSPPAGAGDAALATFYGQHLDWRGCGDGLQCAALRVPVDYQRPAGGSLEVALDRLPATGPGSRIGSLVVDPGGPGASGVDRVRGARGFIPPAVLQRYDIVGLDPRGVGRSDPVRCQTDAETDRFIAIDGTPDDAAERQALDQEARLFAARCQERAGRLLAHISTHDVARDVDVLRAVLGDQKLNYLGESYGTFIGATYAELYPHQVGRLVLDGALDPALGPVARDKAQAVGFDTALRSFAADCVTRSDCPLQTTDPAAGVRRVAGFLDQVDTHPLPGNGDRQLTQSLALLGVAFPLYFPEQGWPALRVGLDRAFHGDGSMLLQLADGYTRRDPSGHYASNQNDVIYAVNCLDSRQEVSVSDSQALVASFRRAAPVFGPYLAWSELPCAHWPVPAVSQPHRVSAPGAAPILVIGTTRDPATPYAWARSLAGQLQSGVLLTYAGDGHTAYGRGVACIDDAVDAYLLAGRPPAPGTRCS